MDQVTKRLMVVSSCLVLSSAAWADGAVAIADDPKGSAWSIEIRNNEPADVARQTALKRCRERTIESKFDPDLCKVVAEYKGLCSAAFMKPTKAGEGWAVARTLEEARESAKRMCMETGSNNSEDCKQLVAGCDSLADESKPGHSN